MDLWSERFPISKQVVHFTLSSQKPTVLAQPASRGNKARNQVGCLPRIAGERRVWVRAKREILIKLAKAHSQVSLPKGIAPAPTLITLTSACDQSGNGIKVDNGAAANARQCLT